MPCSADSCDIHDYPVAPGGGWCRAVDTAYLRSQRTPRSGSHTDDDLAEAVTRLGDILDRMERRQSNWVPPPASQQPPRTTQRKGGTPL
jgi:hypothetical protein